MRGLLLLVDGRAQAVVVAPRISRSIALSATAAAVLAVVVCSAAFDVPHRLQTQYDAFVQDRFASPQDIRGRLLQAGNDGRLPMWKVSRDDYRAHRLHGTGAGSFELSWELERTQLGDRVDAHSLYVEVLGEWSSRFGGQR